MANATHNGNSSGIQNSGFRNSQAILNSDS